MINIYSEEDMYYITNSKSNLFLSRSLEKVKIITMAGIWNEIKANNVLEHLPKHLTFTDSWLVKKFEQESEDVKCSEVHENFINFEEFEDKIVNLYKLSQELREYDNNIDSQYKNIELELCDIYHYIEFSKLDVVSGYRAYVKLREALNKRRQLKDEKLLLDNLKESNSLGCNVNRITNSLDGLKNREYKPRILKELF